MSILSIVGEAKRKLAVARTAKTKEEKAKERVTKAVGRIQLERALELLRVAKLERRIKEAEAEAALASAKAGVDIAKAQQLRASQEKWRARYSRIGAVVSPFRPVARGAVKGARATARGVAKLQREYYGEAEPRRRKKRVAAKTVAKKPVTKKRVTARR